MWIPGGGHSLKIGDGGSWPHWPPFSTRSHPLTPFFIHFQAMTPIFDDSPPIFENSYRMTPSWQHFVKFSFFFPKILIQNVSKLVLCMENLSKYVLFSPFDPPFCFVLFFFLGGEGLSLNDSLFQRNNSHWKIPSFELLSKHPRHFQSWVPPRWNRLENCIA